MSELDIAQSVAFFRHKFVPFRDAQLSIASSPVLYGLSVYSVSNALWNQKTKKLYVFRLRDHFERIVNSAKIMDFSAFVEEWTYADFESTVIELLKRNKVREDVLIRATVFIDEISPGTRISGLANSLSIYIYPMGELLARSGINVCVSSWLRTPDNSIPARAKVNGSYINASLMKNEALQNGYEEAIALDEHGHVAESTVSNLFLVRGGTLVTPDTATDILEGITRDTVIRLAKHLKLPHTERSVDRSELYIADEAFLCGSSARITPIVSIDKRQIGNGLPGAITRKLMEQYESVQRGTISDFPEWRTSVK
jgi:branched-chain amino acid aminotransferase